MIHIDNIIDTTVNNLIFEAGSIKTEVSKQQLLIEPVVDSCNQLVDNQKM